MVKKIELGKRLKITKAQKNMFAAVAGSAVVLGACLVLGVYFLKYIRFNSAVINAKSEAIAGYSDSIKNIGVCRPPVGSIYNSAELSGCEPNEIRPSEVPDSLRYNVIVNMAQNKQLGSVARNDLSSCVNPVTKEKLSYDELYQQYEIASASEKEKKFNTFLVCSALRTIPDALPSGRNPSALGASINKIFNESSFEFESILPGTDVEIELDVPGLRAMDVNLSVEADGKTVMNVLYNIERSIREISIKNATITWSGDNRIVLNANGVAYYTEKAELNEGIVTVSGDGKVVKSNGETEE